MRTLLRLILVVVVVFAAGTLLLGWWAGRTVLDRDERPTATSGTVDTERARAIGAEVGERVATAGARAQAELAEASITSRIKAKLALDDLVDARTIDVDTAGSTVTLRGRVGSAAARERAERLARETEGVTAVVNRLEARR